MTFGVTPEGFRAKRFDDIITDLGEDLKTQLGIDIDADPDSIAKVLTNIYALPLAEEWALSQSLQAMFDIDKSEGVHLDNLVGYLGLRRFAGAYTSGKQYVTCDKATTITPSSLFKDAGGREFNNPTAFTVTPSDCVEAHYTLLNETVVGRIYTVQVNGLTSSTTVQAGEDSWDATGRLISSITASSNGASALREISDGIITISIYSTDDKIQILLTTSTNLTLKEVTSFGEVNYTLLGDYAVSASTVVVPPPLEDILSTTNRYAYTSGRLEETDQELRERHTASLSAAGGSTVEAIRADLLRVEGVTTAIVLENDETVVVDGMPPKSFTALVKGGDEAALGESLWLTKPAGITSHGNTTVPVVDSQGTTQYVSFSRPSQEYIHVLIDYTIYQEEAGEFPIDGESQMVQQAQSFGEELEIGEDVIPQRLSSSIFNLIGGLQRVVVYLQKTTSPYDSPVPEDWTEYTIAIDQLSEANFSEDRIIVVEVV